MNMKLVNTLFCCVLLWPSCCLANECGSVILRFTLVLLHRSGPTGVGPTEVLQVSCCASILATLQFLENGIDVDRGERNIIATSNTGDCEVVEVGLLPQNINGNLFAKCNAEEGLFNTPCESRSQRIVQPTTTTPSKMQTVTSEIASTESHTQENATVVDTTENAIKVNTTQNAMAETTTMDEGIQ